MYCRNVVSDRRFACVYAFRGRGFEQRFAGRVGHTDNAIRLKLAFSKIPYCTFNYTNDGQKQINMEVYNISKTFSFSFLYSLMLTKAIFMWSKKDILKYYYNLEQLPILKYINM